MKRTLKPFVLVLLVCGILTVVFAQSAGAANVTIVHTSNVYGNVLPYNYFSNSYESKGLVQIATYVKELKSSNGNVLLVDTGNLTFGSPFGDYFIDKEPSENPVLTLFNQIGYDVFVPGTFELSLGKEKLSELCSNLKAQPLAANLSGDLKLMKTYYLKVFDNGVKVAIVGVVPEYGNLVYSEYVKTLRKTIDTVKKELSPDIIVLATSGGITFDPVTGKQKALKSELNIGDNLVKDFSKDVNVFLFGNQALVYTGKKENKVFSLPGAGGASLNRIDITLKYSGKRWDITNIVIKNILMSEVKPSQSILSWAQQYEPQVQKWLSETVAKTPVTVGFNKYMTILDDSPITELINKTLIKYSKADIGIWNVFNPNFEGIIEGDITRQQIYSMIGKTTTFKVVQLSGKQVKDIIKNNLQMLSFDGGKVLFSKVLLQSPWLYDLFENLEYEVVLNGGFIRKIAYSGKPVDDGMMFLVSVPSFRTYGENPILSGNVVKEYEIPVQSVLFAEVQRNGILGMSEDRNRTSSVLLKYTVQPGDTFRKVAYRLGVPEEELLALNPIITNPNLLRPGWNIVYYRKYLDLIPPLKELFQVK
jgi:2',3'-cyclic-nucleotide 2'-phosphodiesterase/3'-nucleotidase